MSLDKKYDHSVIEKKWTTHWTKRKLYRADPKSKKELYSIDTPPPTVSGTMHAGHAFSYTQQDFIARYQRMIGKNVFFPFGTDDNGLPTERLVEQLKNVDSSSMKRAAFVALCDKTIKEIQQPFVQDWIDIGMSCDFSTMYSTISKYCQKTSQASFLELYKKGYVYREETPISWCVTCQTAIAQAEFENVSQQSTFNDIAFQGSGKELVVATTRPELLAACVGLCYHPDDIRYKHLKGTFATVPLFDYDVPIFADESVFPEIGTGLIMVCTFGDKEDVEKWHKHKLELRIIFTKDGKLNELAEPYKGLSIKEVRKKIIEDLDEKNLLKEKNLLLHNVNVHERCGTEVEFLKTPQWYVKTLDKKHELIEAAGRIRWHPEHMKIRYVHWVENLNWDWCISRQRHFGIPFPVWFEKDTGNIILAEEAELPVDPEKDKPRNYKGDAKNLIPDLDVMDTWATSSVSPQIILDWKGKSGYDFSFDHYPCSMRPQAHDIIRTWAFYTIVKGIYQHKKAPWYDIVISGHVLAEDGKKLSKKKGNYTPPQEIVERYGADALRLWAASAKLGDDLRYREEDIKTEQKTITKLWNASKFVFQHLEDYTLKKEPKNLSFMDQWLLLKLNKTINQATQWFEIYEFSKAKKETDQFFWMTFCDNYLEIVKDRLYNPDERGKEEQASGQYALHQALLCVLKLFSPIMPFVTEELYMYHYASEEKKESIHVSEWPVLDTQHDDVSVEETGDRFVTLLSDVRKYKSEQGKSLKTEVTITLEKKDLDLLKPCLDDFKASTQAKEIKEGKTFSVSF